MHPIAVSGRHFANTLCRYRRQRSESYETEFSEREAGDSTGAGACGRPADGGAPKSTIAQRMLR
jgi:hypothetical protein